MTAMKTPRLANRRTVLKTLGTGVVGGTVLTGSASAGHGTDPIKLQDLDFHPDSYSFSLSNQTSVTWKHADSGPGFIHNVALDHESMRSRVKSNPLNFGDTYTVDFEERMVRGKRWLVISDGNQHAVADFSDGKIGLHVHCDLHSPEMEMESFTVKA